VDTEPMDSAEDSAEAENGAEQMLCTNCVEAIPARADFCPHCGAGVGPYCMWDPWKRIFAVGHVYRHVVSKPISRFAFWTWMVCIFSGLFVYVLPIITGQIQGAGTSGAVGIAWVMLYVILMLLFALRIIRNYRSQGRDD
jgi:hypothetical protein